MTKKFFSLVLSLVLVIGLLPVMNVSASEVSGTVYHADDFENFVVDTVYADYNTKNSPVTDAAGNTKWKLGYNVRAKVVSMSGADGKTTKAMELSLLSDGATNKDYNRFKFVFGNDVSLPESGYLIVSADFYLPTTGTFKDWSMNPIKKRVGNLVCDGNNNDVGDFDVGKWHQITVVCNIDTDDTIYYVNGELTSYCKYKYDTEGSFPSVLVFTSNNNKTPGVDKLIIDNVNFWHSPSATKVSTNLNGSTSVGRGASPTVNFSEKLLETTVHSDGIISAEKNITFVKTEEPSATVAISELNISEDGKSLTIVPAEDLDKATEYTVTVSGLKDMYGRDIDSYTFSFTTVDDYKITAATPVFSKVDLVNPGVASQEIQALENGYINASCTVTNSASTDTEVLMIAVLKDDNTFEKMQFKSLLVPANGSATFNGGFNIDNYSTQKIEIYAWDNLYNMTPLASKYDISASGINELSVDN